MNYTFLKKDSKSISSYGWKFSSTEKTGIQQRKKHLNQWFQYGLQKTIFVIATNVDFQMVTKFK